MDRLVRTQYQSIRHDYTFVIFENIGWIWRIYKKNVRYFWGKKILYSTFLDIRFTYMSVAALKNVLSPHADHHCYAQLLLKLLLFQLLFIIFTVTSVSTCVLRCIVLLYLTRHWYTYFVTLLLHCEHRVRFNFIPLLIARST